MIDMFDGKIMYKISIQKVSRIVYHPGPKQGL
jgi:hypothetical protein